VCVSQREGESDRERVCECVSAREGGRGHALQVVCVCERERGRTLAPALATLGVWNTWLLPISVTAARCEESVLLWYRGGLVFEAHRLLYHSA